MKKTLLLALALAAACADAAPAYYRQQIGDLRVTALFDGTLHLPRGDIKNIPAEDVAKLLADSSAATKKYWWTAAPPTASPPNPTNSAKCQKRWPLPVSTPPTSKTSC